VELIVFVINSWILIIKKFLKPFNIAAFYKWMIHKEYINIKGGERKEIFKKLFKNNPRRFGAVRFKSSNFSARSQNISGIPHNTRAIATSNRIAN